MSSKNKKTRKIIVIVLIGIVGIVLLFFVLADYIVLDDCASPCRHTSIPGVCPTVCDRVTLLDWILGNG